MLFEPAIRTLNPHFSPGRSRTIPVLRGTCTSVCNGRSRTIPVLRGTCTSVCNGRSRTSLCFAAPARPWAMAAPNSYEVVEVEQA